MNPILIYILKGSIGIALVTIPYLLFLRNDAALHLKRFYLLSGLLASWIFPWLAFQKPATLNHFSPSFFLDPGAEGIPLMNSATGEMIRTGEPQLLTILIAIYLTGVVILLAGNLFTFRRIARLRRNRVRGELRETYTGEENAFTLFLSIYIPKKYLQTDDLESILIHERAHISQRHFYDLMLSEVSLIVTWFNPFSWLISRMIKENHEHLADRAVLSQGVNPAHYKAQLLNHTLGVNLFRLGNQFNHSLTKKRFNMMKKMKEPGRGFLKYVVLVPAVLVVLGLFTAATAQQTAVKGKVVFSDTGKPASGASVIISGTTMGTVTDAGGQFTLETEGNPDLVISFVGYQTVVINASKVARRDIELPRKAYNINLDDIEITGYGDPDPSVSIINAKGNLNGEPVYVVDGEVVDRVDDISPDLIEKIDVYKDPDSPLIKKYKAEHGLIMITLKSSQPLPNMDDEETFFVVEQMPSFPGGNVALKKYIYEHLDYPGEAARKNLSGEVHVEFTVNTQGNLENIRTIQSTGKVFNEPAMEIFRNMPAWIPGFQRGKKVSVNFIVPVRFTPPQE